MAHLRAERPAEWNRLVAPVIAGFLVPESGRVGFHADMRTLVRGDLRLTELAATPLEAQRSSTPRAAGVRSYSFTAQLSGHSVLETDGQSAPLRPGDVAFHSDRVHGTFRTGDGYRMVSLIVPERALPVPAHELADSDVVFMGGGTALVDAFQATIAAVTKAVGRIAPAAGSRALWAATDLATTMLLVEWGARGGQFADALSLETVKAHALQNLSDPDLDLAALAAMHHVSIRTVQRLFKEAGESAPMWLRERRLDKACRELTDPALTQASIASISRRVGFRTPTHFGQLFRERFGTTPNVYRSRHRLD